MPEVFMLRVVVFEPGEELSVRTFEGAAVSVGRSSDNDLVLGGLSVSKRHARLVGRDGAWHVIDAGSQNGTFVNGFRLQPGEERRLEPGDRLGVGDFDLQLGDALAAVPPLIEVVLHERGARTHRFALDGPVVTVGADPSCDLRLSGAGVSPRHCRVVVQDGRLVAADLRSEAGTFLPAGRLESPRVLGPGDWLEVGDFRIALRLLGADDAEPSFAPFEERTERVVQTEPTGEATGEAAPDADPWSALPRTDPSWEAPPDVEPGPSLPGPSLPGPSLPESSSPAASAVEPGAAAEREPTPSEAALDETAQRLLSRLRDDSLDDVLSD